MTTIGQIEKKTQERVIKLFDKSLGYNYLGNWIDRDGNSNVEEGMLRAWLEKRKYDKALIDRALFLFDKAVNDQSKSLYDRNKDVYSLLRYGVKFKPEVGENTHTVKLIDWKKPEDNDFAIAEEVTVTNAEPKGHPKRPDIVLYVNGIALGILELKRSTVSVAEGIRQNLDNQKREFIQPFFSTVQLVMAGNDSEGLRYATIETKEKYYLTWKEESSIANHLDRDLSQICNKRRFLELIRNFIVFDAGTKKICRHNQYFGVKEAQDRVKKREGGIIWHTQGSGKSLTMVWLAKWIREHVTKSRVLIITDRTELDEQIEKIFLGVDVKIHRTKSGADLISCIGSSVPRLICSLIHKFGSRTSDEDKDIVTYIEEIKSALPKDFIPKGDIFIFVDECHRTQSGLLHKAMKTILPNAMLIGFTGTPLLKTDKQKSIEVFGRYIHTYKFDEAVKDKVIVDLRYEARDIDQHITSQAKIDEWFAAKTNGLTDFAKAQIKKRWGTLQKVLSSQSRLGQIVADIMMDMNTKPRLMDGRGNAMLVSGSIYQACKFYELFSKTELKGKCAIITSYSPYISDIKGEESGEGETENIQKYEIYKNMLAEWFKIDPEEAVKKAEAFEIAVKKKFVKEPGQMKLLIVVDKLLTGFDAPPATYLYIDKHMRDHGLFQAICRINRLDTEDKEYGYIIDYKDLFQSLEGAVKSYTKGAFDGYDKDDVANLLSDRLSKSKEKLDAMRESIKALCERVDSPKETADYIHYFCAEDAGNAEQIKETEPKRQALYKITASLLGSYANLANEMIEAGYTSEEIKKIKEEVKYYENVRTEVRLASGDHLDMKMYEPSMRLLIDTYIRADASEKISAFDDMSLVQLILERGDAFIHDLPPGMKNNEEAVAETITNNVRRLIIDEHPINPRYYDKMSELLDALIEQRRQKTIAYQQYLQQIVELTGKVHDPKKGGSYPGTMDTSAKRALFDNLNNDEALALSIDKAIRDNYQDDWRNHPIKTKMVKRAIKKVLKDDAITESILEIVKNQNEY